MTTTVLVAVARWTWAQVQRFQGPMRFAVLAVVAGIALMVGGSPLLLVGATGVVRTGFELAALGGLGAGFLAVNGARVAPARGRIQVEPRHEAWARRIVARWPSMSTACGLGVPTVVRDREWVPARGAKGFVTGTWHEGVVRREMTPLTLEAITSSPLGLRLHLRLVAGVTTAAVEKAGPALAEATGAATFAVERASGGCILDLYDGADPFSEPISWDVLGDRPARAADGVPVWRTVNGDVVRVPVVEGSLLLGGIPGSGKSGAQTVLLAGLAEMIDVALIGLDAKRGVELAPWAPRFSAIESDVEAMAPLLRRIMGEIDRRYDALRAEGRKKWRAEDGPYLALVVDELAMITATGDKKGDSERAALLRQIVAVGRAAGVFTSLATQKPSADVVPTSLRDLISQRCAMRCTTREQAATVLGGVPSEVLEAVTAIPSQTRGLGIVTTETGETVRARAAWIPDDGVAAFAQMWSERRWDLPWLTVDAAVGVVDPDGC